MLKKFGRRTSDAARSRKAIESKEEHILPARFDDTEIPGLHKHIMYVDLRKKTPDELVSLIMQKLGREMIPF